MLSELVEYNETKGRARTIKYCREIQLGVQEGA